MTAALSLAGVAKAYGKVQALDGLDLEVPNGAICGLVGPNGAGKTTTFGIVGGMVRPDAGTVDILGEGPFDPLRHAGRVTLLPQDCELNPYLPVRALLVHYGRLQGLGAAGAEREADRTLDQVELRDRARSRVRELSHGMRRRVAVAQAFLGSPELVLLDEPTSGLDPHLVVRMREIFLAARGRATLVVSSHVLAELEACCDHVVFMDNGRVTRSGPIAHVTGRGEVVRVALESPVPLDALQAALPGVALRWEESVLVLECTNGTDVPALNALALPALVSAGARILEVRRGRSLEETYMAARTPLPATPKTD